MKARRVWVMALIGASLCAGYKISYEDESLYQALDTLAEVMTVAAAHSPEQISSQKLVEGAIDGFLAKLDPHTGFYNSDQYQTMKEDQHGSFYGVGIIVGTQNEKLTVVSPMAGGPAALAGIRAGDVLAQINDTPSVELSSDDAVRLLRGEAGSSVRLTITRAGFDKPLTFTLARAEIPSYDVRTSFMVDGNTGYVALKEFGETATAEVTQALNKMSQAGMTQLILDLRGNPGGLLPQAIDIVGLFLKPESLVVSTKGRMDYASEKYFSSKKPAPFENLPLIVLIDRGSASASEIVAGAIQDHDRGLVIGVTSWGKGLVQSVFPMSDGETGLALTTSRYYTPSGRHIQGNFEVLEEYYNPKSAKDQFFATTGEDTTGFRTAHGRPVHQDRGVTPDVYLSDETESDLAMALEAANAFFNFATANQESVGKVTRDFEVDDRLLDSFKAWLAAEKIEAPGFDHERDVMRAKLTFQFFYIGSSRESEEWAWRYRCLDDLHLKASVDLFPQARELLQVYLGKATLRPDYSAELKAYSRRHEKDAPQSAALTPEPSNETKQ